MPPVSEFALELTARTKAYFEKEAERRGVPLLEATKASLLYFCSEREQHPPKPPRLDLNQSVGDRLLSRV
jgi:hypothetical protein